MNKNQSKYKDKAWLDEQYQGKGKSGQDIAKECGVSGPTIYRWLHKFNIDIRDRFGENNPRWKGGKVEVICKQCGRTYKARSYRKERSSFCSKECQYKWQRKKKIELTCEQCGRIYKVEPYREEISRFCSRGCKDKWRSENLISENSPNWKGGKEELICEQCGEIYKVDPNEKEESRFCSRECLYRWRSENTVGEDHPLWKEKIELTCKYCGEIFEVIPSEKERSKFCSKECYSKWQSEEQIGENHPNWKEVELVCEQCGEIFEVPPSQIDGRRFCSRECTDKWRSENLVGENHWNWQGGPKNSLKQRLRRDIANGMRKALRNDKNGYHWEDLVSYNLEDLKQHLEKQFEDGMTWDNHGLYGWHIDHIKPVASFEFTKPEDEEFQKCFALDNLQPLWAEENWKKSDKLNWQS